MTSVLPEVAQSMTELINLCVVLLIVVYGMLRVFLLTDPRGLASQKQCTQALYLISLNTLNVFLHYFLIIPFSRHALLDTHNPPPLICTPPFSHHPGVPKYTLFTPSWCSKIHTFHTHDFTSSPKISQNEVDSQS